MRTVIQAENLTRRFGDFVAVDHLTFELKAGQIMGYLGPNGSGKTTTIRMLLGLLRPSEGWARVLDFDVVTQSEAVRAHSGYMSQKFALYGDLTVEENLTFYAGVYGVKDEHRPREVLDSLGLTPMLHQRVQNLSAGWRQRLALAAAIVHQPGLLFLDEPTSGVDPVARRAFWDLIYELAEQAVTVLVSTHYMDEAEYCGVVGIMRAGRLLAFDEPGRLKRSLPGQIWDIYADPLLTALDELETLQGVQQVSLVSDHLRLLAAISVDEMSIRQALTLAGIQVQMVTPGEATMEDVFMSHTE